MRNEPSGGGESHEDEAEMGVPEVLPVHSLATHTLLALRMRHIYLLFASGMGFLLVFLIPGTGWGLGLLRGILATGALVFGMAHLFQLNGINEELERRRTGKRQ